MHTICGTSAAACPSSCSPPREIARSRSGTQSAGERIISQQNLLRRRHKQQDNTSQSYSTTDTCKKQRSCARDPGFALFVVIFRTNPSSGQHQKGARHNLTLSQRMDMTSGSDMPGSGRVALSAPDLLLTCRHKRGCDARDKETKRKGKYGSTGRRGHAACKSRSQRGLARVRVPICKGT